MTHNAPQNFPPMFRIDVSADHSAPPAGEADRSDIMIALLRQMLAFQQRQNQLLEELTQHFGQAQRQRATELGQWREANPELARCCRMAAETLSRVQTRFLQNLTNDITDNEDCLLDGEFILNEFVDRYGPRLAHLNGVLQMLSQLSSVPATNNPSS